MVRRSDIGPPVPCNASLFEWMQAIRSMSIERFIDIAKWGAGTA